MKLLSTMSMQENLYNETLEAIEHIDGIDEVLEGEYLYEAENRHALEESVQKVIQKGTLYAIVYSIYATNVTFLMSLTQVVAAYSERPVVLVEVREEWNRKRRAFDCEVRVDRV